MEVAFAVSFRWIDDVVKSVKNSLTRKGFDIGSNCRDTERSF